MSVLALGSCQARADLIYPNLVAGPVGGETTGVIAAGTYEVIVTGNGQHFNAFVAPAESLERSSHNQSFAVYQEWSLLNVTHAEITFTLPAGNYAILVQNLEDGGIVIHDVVPAQSATLASGIPTEMIAMVIVTAGLAASLTYLFFRRRRNE